jgi:DNA-binding NarL/FixJ family response regulator
MIFLGEDIMKMKIRTMIVDDDARFRRSVGEILSREPHMDLIGEAGNGLEALTKARDLKPDLILMDVRMPETNGIEAAHQLKKESPDIQVIMVTTYDFDEYKKAARDAGKIGYILKKSVTDLIPAINEIFIR